MDETLTITTEQINDLLYRPAYDAAMRTLDTRAVLVVGDSKMAARATRAHIVAGGSTYLCAYRPAIATAEIARWIDAALAAPKQWQELRAVDERTGEITTLAVIHEGERTQQDGETTWTERVLVNRSAQVQAGLRRKRERALTRVAERLAVLARPPQQGRRGFATRADLETTVAALLRTEHVEGVVWVEPAEATRRDGTACWIVGSFGVDLGAWQAMVDRLGWQVSLTNTTTAQYAAPALVRAYRQQVIQERGFARLKTRNLHIRSLYLSDERRVAGLTWLLCLALRVLTLTEYRLRTALQQRGETLTGLNPAARTQATPQQPAARELTAAERHTQGLERVTATLHGTKPDEDPRKAYRSILEMKEKGTLDPALGEVALHLAHPDHCTTARLEMSVSDAALILGQLLLNLEEWGPGSLPSGLPEETMVGNLADHAAAITAFANALIPTSFDEALREDARREEQAAKSTPPQEQHAPPAAARRRARTVKPSTVERLEHLRQEFADDPQGIDLLIALAHVSMPDEPAEGGQK